MNNSENQILLLDDTKYETSYPKKFLLRKKYQPAEPGKILAFIPGVIKNIFVKENQIVKKGEPLLILEAMKMKNEIKAPFNGQIQKIHCILDEKVSKLQLLIEMK